MSTVSIVIRCFNEEKHIGTLLDCIKQQITSHHVQIVVVDSGSTDRTVEIATSHGVSLIQITPEQFTFGYSLNKGIEASSGEFCLIVSAHCYPVDSYWVENMVKPFLDDSSVAIVYGRQTGTEASYYSEQQIFKQWFPANDEDDASIAFCNNANSAIRKSVWETYKFDENLTGLEDLDWAKSIKKKNMSIKYVPSASVYHIHEESSKKTYNRYYREALAYRQIYPSEHFSFFDFIRFYIANVFSDLQHSIHDKVFYKEFRSILRFRFLQFWGTYSAHQYKVSIHGPMKKRLYYPIKMPKKAVAKKVSTTTKPELKSLVEHIDITRPLSSRTPVWPGVKGFTIETLKDVETYGVEESQIKMNLHCGTHVDSPLHFIKEGKSIDEVCLKKLIGDTYVVEYKEKTPIETKFFTGLKLPSDVKKVLIKTKNSDHREGEFPKDYIAITQECAAWIANQKYDLIGIDGPSIQLYSDPDNTTHEELLKNEIVILEGLDLSRAEAGRTYHLTVLPLKIDQAEAAPARAILTNH